tara:strand:- start:53 stop:3742 length:3690 start_codon:yes stop_codon:yes gene_type:complete
MDIYHILEKGEKLHEAEANAWYNGDVVGIARAQQGQRALEDELMSEPVSTPSNSMFYRALKPVLAGASILTSAILGAGVANDLAPSLEEPVIYHVEDNAEPTDYGHQLTTEQSFNTEFKLEPLTEQSIVGYHEYNITLEDDCIKFPEGTSARFVEDLEPYIDNEGRHRYEEKPLNWTLEDPYRPSDTDSVTQKNVTFCNLGNEQYRLEFNNDLVLTGGERFSNLSNLTHTSDLEEHQGNYEFLRLNIISPTEVQFNRLIRDMDDNTLSNTYETYQIGDQVDLFGGNVLTLDNISEDGAHFSQDYILNISENDFNEGNKSLHINNQGMIDLKFQSVTPRGMYHDQNNNLINYREDLRGFDLRADFFSSVRDEFPILGINEKKVIEDNSINEINIERVWSNKSQDYNVELDVNYVNAFGEDNSAKLWFNVTDGNQTNSDGRIPEIDIWIHNYQMNVGRWLDNYYMFDKNMTLDDVSILGNETASQRFVNGDTLINVDGSEANYTEINNKTILNFRESILDRIAPSIDGFIKDNEGNIVNLTDENYNISIGIYDENFRNVSVSLESKKDGTAVPISTELLSIRDDAYRLNVAIPKDIELNEYLLNVTAEDNVDNVNSVSKRIIHTDLEQPQPDLNSFIANYHDGKITIGGQFESDHSGELELKIFNESGVEVFAKNYSDLNKTSIFSEEVDLQGGEYTAKLVRTENVSKINSLFREDNGACMVGNGSDLEDYCESAERILEEWPTLTFTEINSVSGNATTGEGEVIEIKTEIDGQNYTNYDLQLKDNGTLNYWDIRNEIRNAIQNNELHKLENILTLPGGKTFLGFETQRRGNIDGELEYTVIPHLWTTKEFNISPGERPNIGSEESFSAGGTVEWDDSEIIDYIYYENQESKIEFVKALEDGSVIIKPRDSIESYAINNDTGEEFYREGYTSDNFVLANPNEVISGASSVSVSSIGQVETLERVLGESRFDVWSPPVIPEPEPVDNNTNGTNETIPEPENNNTNGNNNSNETIPETNETKVYVPRENPLIFREFTCEGTEDIKYRMFFESENWETGFPVVVTPDGKMIERFLGGKHIRFDEDLSKYSHLNVYSIDREELFKQRGDLTDFIINPNGSEFNPEDFEQFNYSNPIRIAIPDIDSCEVPASEDTRGSIEPEESDKLDPLDWAMYSAAGLSGVLALDVLAGRVKGRKEKKEEDDLGKWDATREVEAQMDSNDLTMLATELNRDSEE